MTACRNTEESYVFLLLVPGLQLACFMPCKTDDVVSFGSFRFWAEFGLVSAHTKKKGDHKFRALEVMYYLQSLCIL